MDAIYAEIRAERERQDSEWGGPSHDDHHGPLVWVGLLTWHLGRAAMADINALNDGEYRSDLVAVAALAVAAIAAYDRQASNAR